MPELPEVEVTRLSLRPGLEGARVRGVRLGKALRWPLVWPDAQGAGRLQEALVGPLGRRGKYLWLPLEAAPGRPTAGGLLLHLGMSGALRFWSTGQAPEAGPHDHFDLLTDRGVLRLHDPRRFGAVLWSGSLDEEPASALLARLGPEPWDPGLDDARFHAVLKARRSPIKSVLLSGEAVVGAGNIYACEALFESGIHPAARACTLSRPRAAKLLAAVRRILQRAIELGGSTLRDFSNAHGMDGEFQTQAQVYGRAGLPCPRCGAAIRRVVQGQRATYFCGACQKR